MDSLADAVAGLEEARVTCHFQQLITRLAQLQKDVDELKCIRVSEVEESSPEETSLLPTPACAGARPPFNLSQSPAVADFAHPGPWMPSNFPQSPALLDVSNRSVGGGAVTSYEHAITQEDIDQCLAACRS